VILGVCVAYAKCALQCEVFNPLSMIVPYLGLFLNTVFRIMVVLVC
jgi:hypothetical protein